VSTRPAPPDQRDVVALAHGTVGVARGCAVSSRRAFADHAAGLARFMRAGYAVVVPDLAGLGTAGTQPYLIGDATARATLDAVRATRRFAPAQASERFVAWGVGQGGHAALFTGQQAAAYAPELELAGVAAAAPPANLARMLEADAGTPAGDVVAAYVLSTWSRAYPQLRLDDLLTGPARATVERIAERCVEVDHGGVPPALDGRPVKLAYRVKAPWRRAPWKALLARNSPGARTITAPVIITQGSADRLVRATSTARFARYLCDRGTTLQYRPSRRLAHGDVGEKTAPYVARWIARRFAGERARETC
jgi:alpha-beta hydrolase superfamily lysophospholipase